MKKRLLMLVYFLTPTQKEVTEFRIVRNLLLRTRFGEPGHRYAGEVGEQL